VRRLEPLSEAATLELARRWSSTLAPSAGEELVAGETLREAWHLTQQFLGAKAAPGNLMELLEATRQRLAAAGMPHAITVEDLIATLGQLSGLPASILDERQGLDLAALRSLFESRVLGQPEAIDCLVERVAMIKAGVCDPQRPFGVFLFAGPTGTGKTEIAKTLAAFLFGSAERLLRVDMSELQTPESLARILGDPNVEGPTGALVDLVRRQPFAVVLLDEIEKAHPNVWDLFLQVFDDGRLSDRRGLTTDFRHTIVIMTSNLGSAVASGPALGFREGDAGFSKADVHKALGRAFRKEFLNRIDRIVVFRPLQREVMRKILQRELADAFRRRGLRNRAWAVEWSEEALDFLLAEGFTPDLGARPLRRAIEHHLLAPLAVATVNREVPSGDQFLFVGSDGKQLSVEFVDPDRPDEPATSVEPASAQEADADAAPSLRRIAAGARGDARELAFLKRRCELLAERLDSDAWRGKKEIALSMTALPDFWSSPERHAILGQAEALDRIDVGARTARSLLDRLHGSDGGRRRTSPDLVRRLALQLHLLEPAVEAVAAGRGWDAFLQVEAGAGLDGERSSAFAVEIGAMYKRWAERRRMRLAVLDERDGGAEPYRLVLAVSGFAAFDLLADEDGFHVLEVARDGGAPGAFDRAQARVRVVAQPPTAAGSPEALLAQARATLDGAAPNAGATPRVVRRYRRGGAPLVRDAVRGWRSGRLDLVLDGDFDLME
jgi:ATP-dependent Clp protease ATP-binding subunit ClpC